MPQSVLSGGSAAGANRYVQVILLNKEVLCVSVESKSTKVSDIFTKACEHVELQETEFFGLAQLKDNEFQFLQLDLKISKLASKIWKSKEFSADEPLQTFYLRVQYYVDNICLLKEKTTRLQYYLQLRDNLLHYHQAITEEKCFLLASYALQADFGRYKAGCHGNDYFDPREYFPASVVMRRGQDYITTHLPVMHNAMAGLSQAEARVNYIVELSTPPIAHNFHFYKMRKRKYDTSAVAWIAIGPRALQIYEESDEFRCPLSLFLWTDIESLHCEKKKFEVITEGNASRKYLLYTDCKEWGQYIVGLCRSTLLLHQTLKSRLEEICQAEGHDQRFREMYVYSENAEFTLDRRRSGNRIVAPDDRILPTVHEHLIEPSSNYPAVDIQPSNGAQGSRKRATDKKEIFITSPPYVSSSSNSRSTELPQFLPTSGINNQEKHEPHFGLLLEANEHLQQMLAGWDSSDGHSRDGSDVHISHPCQYSVSSSVPASSSESLTFLPFTRVDSFRLDQPHSTLSPSSSGSSNAPSHVTSALTTPSLCSTSPNSSAGSGNLPLSLPPSKRVYDAAVLCKATPLGTSFNEYLRKIYTGQEDTSDSKLSPRKSSLDYHQLHPNMFVEPVQRSTSLRQPLVERHDGKAWKLFGARPKISAGLSVSRSNSDKSQKSSLFALYSDAQRAVARSESNKSQKSSMLSLPSDVLIQANIMQSDSNMIQKSSTVTVTRSDSDKSHKSSMLSLPSEIMAQANVVQSDSSTNQKPSTVSATRSDSDENQRSSSLAVTCSDSQKSSALSMHYNVLSQTNVTRSESSKSQKYSMLALHTDVSGLPNVTQSYSNKSEQLTLPALHSDVSSQANVARSDSNKSQTSPSLIQPTAVRSNVKSQLHSASAVHQDACSHGKSKEEPHQSSSLPFTIMPVEAQIQKLRFVPTMTAVSTPVRPTPEKPVGSLPMYHQHHHHPAYIPELLSASVIKPLLQPAGILCKPYQEVAVNATPSDASYQKNAAIVSADAISQPLFQPSPATFIPVPSLVFEPSEDELLENNGSERGSPPPYGAFHSTMIAGPPSTINPTVTQMNTNIGNARNERSPGAWLLLNNTGHAIQQPQAVSLKPVDVQNSSRATESIETALASASAATTVSDQHNNKGKKSEVVRHQSDKYPGFRNPQCPRHGSGWDIREKLRSLGPSVPPMLNALLTDKSLHDTHCTCNEDRNSKRLSYSSSSDALNLPGTVSRPRSWSTERFLNGDQNLQCFPDSSFSSYDATMIINGTMTMNGSPCSDEADGDQPQLNTSPTVQAGSNRLKHHSSDCGQMPLSARQLPFNHNQSNSDSAAQNVV